MIEKFTAILNDANPFDTLLPAFAPCVLGLAVDLSNLNNNLDDFTLQVSIGVAASERVVFYGKFTSNGTDISMDRGSANAVVIKERRIPIFDGIVYFGEQTLIALTKNGLTDRNVPYMGYFKTT